ncbi:alpha/beta hydrolase family protein [Pseudonocardia sp. TRM90224]|uniref:alpha/beta hydrolase family protein n=1 Tax=Pseudonocardia sp. TRM90224 TaxID=2812678 RepID=UPI001E58985E|nr:alpha/beta fold hydrolase [Pseudonocardia sp. TRM90224]
MRRAIIALFALVALVACGAPSPESPAAPARPQTPQPPFPYRAEDVTFPSGGITLAGTLTVPEGPGPFAAVLLITGSGPQDRDETLFDHKPFLLLADTITRAGLAVLRVDDRGVGGSGGNLDESTYDDLAADALAGVTFLKGRPEVDDARIGLFGHSEGGYLAPLVAQRAPRDVAFVAMMAGPAVSGSEVLELQNKLIYEQLGATPDQVEQQVGFIREHTRLMRAGEVETAHERARAHITEAVAALPADQRPDDAAIDAQARQLTSPYFASFLLYDPAQALAALSVPVLAFYGDKDVQVPATQSEPVLRTLLAPNPQATIRTFAGLNHLMQPAQTGGVTEYQTIETTIAPEVLDLVTTWSKERAT